MNLSDDDCSADREITQNKLQRARHQSDEDSRTSVTHDGYSGNNTEVGEDAEHVAINKYYR